MQPVLSFEQAPPISVPFRFFLTAPLFGLAAALLLMWQPAAILDSRWTPASFALTHLIALGFMLQVMCGALLQMIPVVVGANIWQPRRVTMFTHAGLTIGTILLIGGFLSGAPVLFRAATPFLGISLGVFALIVLIALLRTPAEGPTIVALRLSVLAFLVTILLGAALGASSGWQIALPAIDWTDMHAAWGLVGWSLLLLAGVAFLVVPMFQLTPAYPGLLARSIPLALFALLCIWSFGSQFAEWARIALECMGAALIACFALVTLRLQSQRRRKIVESTLLFWRMSMVALALAAALFAAQQLMPSVADLAATPYWLGALLFAGVFPAVICGMLYKIVPFLVWLHLQKYALAGLPVPNMKQIIPERNMKAQYRVHLLAFALLLAMPALPLLAYAGAAMLALSFILLEWNMIAATRMFVRLCRELEQRQQTTSASQG